MENVIKPVSDRIGPYEIGVGNRLNAKKSNTSTTGMPVLKTRRRRSRASSTGSASKAKLNGVRIKNKNSYSIEEIVADPKKESPEIQALAKTIGERKNALYTHRNNASTYDYFDIEAEIKYLLSVVGECKANELEKKIAKYPLGNGTEKELARLKQRAFDLKVEALTLKCNAAAEMIAAQKRVFCFLAENESLEKPVSLQDAYFMLCVKVIEKQSLSAEIYLREAAEIATALAGAKAIEFNWRAVMKWKGEALSYTHQADKFRDERTTTVQAKILEATIRHETTKLETLRIVERPFLFERGNPGWEKTNKEAIGRLNNLGNATLKLAALENDETKFHDLEARYQGYLRTIEVREKCDSYIVTTQKQSPQLE